MSAEIVQQVKPTCTCKSNAATVLSTVHQLILILQAWHTQHHWPVTTVDHRRVKLASSGCYGRHEVLVTSFS